MDVFEIITALLLCPLAAILGARFALNPIFIKIKKVAKKADFLQEVKK